MTRLILAAALYALSGGVVVAVLVYEPEAVVKVGMFLLACALVTGGTLALPSDTRKLAATAAGVFLAAAGLISTLLSLGAGEETGEAAPKPPPIASYTEKIAHGSAFPAYEWLAAHKGQVVRLNMLIDLAHYDGVGPGTTAEDALRGNGTRGRDIWVEAAKGDNSVVSFRFLPKGRDAADYMSPEFNDVVRVNGRFRVVEMDPDVGSTQVYAVVLDPKIRR